MFRYSILNTFDLNRSIMCSIRMFITALGILAALMTTHGMLNHAVSLLDKFLD